MRELLVEQVADRRRGAIKIGPFGSALPSAAMVQDGIKVYGQENLIARDWSVGNRRVTPETFYSLRTCELYPGDVVIGMMGSLGHCEVFPSDAERGLMDSHLLRIQPNQGLLTPEYLRLSLLSDETTRQISRLSHGSIMAGLSSKVVRRIRLFVPPLDEQRRIAEVLDTIDKAIQATERVIAKLGHAETAVLVESIDFAGEDAELGDVCALLQDGTHLPPQRTSEGPLLLSVQNLDDGQVQLSARDTHVPEAFWRSTRRVLPIEPGDVCLAVVGATLGKLGVVPPDLPRFTVQRSLTVLRGDPTRMRTDYLFAVMCHGEFQRQLWQRANQTAQPGVYLGELRTIRVPSPLLDEQRRVVRVLNTINETIRINKEQRDKLLQVRSGLAADLLSGRVRTVAA